MPFALAIGMWKAPGSLRECNERGTCSSPAPKGIAQPITKHPKTKQTPKRLNGENEMTITIQIEEERVQIKKGTSNRTGKPYEMREQRAIVHGAGRFPVETTITLPDGVDGYAAGHYEITTPLVVGRYGFDVARDLGLVLIQPAKAGATKAA